MSDAGVAGKLRAQRLPRWTRQEILVLIEGKRVVERSGRGRGRGRSRGGGGGADGGGGTAAVAEPTKWAAVAAYCRRHGVDRGPVQCRKRWSNLAGDYKKVREWESGKGAAGEPSSSFWAMRNDARRERRLPGFFDREVYNVLEGRGAGGNNNAAEAAPRVDLDDADDGKEREKPVRDDGGAKPAGDGLFSSSSDENGDDNDEAATPTPPSLTPALPPMPVLVPVSEKTTEVPRPESSEQAGTSKRKGPAEFTEDSPVQGRQKRQHSDQASGRATTDLQGQLLHVLDRSSGMVAAQLEAQNINSQLDREQRKDQASSLHSALGKMADALYRIADNL